MTACFLSTFYSLPLPTRLWSGKGERGTCPDLSLGVAWDITVLSLEFLQSSSQSRWRSVTISNGRSVTIYDGRWASWSWEWEALNKIHVPAKPVVSPHPKSPRSMEMLSDSLGSLISSKSQTLLLFLWILIWLWMGATCRREVRKDRFKEYSNMWLSYNPSGQKKPSDFLM